MHFAVCRRPVIVEPVVPAPVVVAPPPVLVAAAPAPAPSYVYLVISVQYNTIKKIVTHETKMCLFC